MSNSIKYQTMKIMRLTTMLLLAAMAGASFTSNAKNNQLNNTLRSDSSQEVIVETLILVAPEDSICTMANVSEKCLYQEKEGYCDYTVTLSSSGAVLYYDTFCNV